MIEFERHNPFALADKQPVAPNSATDSVWNRSMPLVLRIKTETTIPLEVDTVRLETVRTQSVDEVLRTPIQHGNRQEPLGDFFAASGSAADDNELVWEGDCSRVKLIGTHLAEGKIRVEGNAGMHLGAEMKGGEIIVNGNSGDWVGAEMHGGRIHVRGNDKEKVGQVAAEIRRLRPPEPYKGKGIRYAGERVRRKAGKAGKAIR